MTNDNFAELVRRWQSGDTSALDELLRTQIGWLQNHVRRRIGSHLRVHDESLDFVQGALVDLCAHDATIEIGDESSLRAVLARIVDHNIRDRHRWLRRQKRDPDRIDGDIADSRVLEGALHEITTPSLAADRRETHALLHRAIEDLDDEDREVIWLHEWERLTHKEIGERLGVSTDVARVRFQRALPKLAKRLKRLRGDNDSA